MMHLRVSDIESWWKRIVDADLIDRFDVRPLQPPRVLWHIAEHLPVEAQGS
jgi:hypothetical protein